MRTLVVSWIHPWPTTSGARMRAANLVEAVATLGEVDVFGVVDPVRLAEAEPSPFAGRNRIVARPPADRVVRRALVAITGRRPARLAARRAGTIATALTSFVQGDYDLVVVIGADAAALLGSALPEGVPTIVDFVDLEDTKIDALAAQPSSPLRRMSRRRDAAAWRCVQRRLATHAAAVTVCSDLDLRRLDAANASVIPNGYTEPPEPVGRPDVLHQPPTVVLCGSFRYPPNADAADVLVREVAPRLRTRIPDITIRLVGHSTPAVEALHEPPGVTVTGFVPDVTAELGRADVAVVPLRVGGGTRIKILEAFAHRLAVVSTSMGIEGLDVEHGRHALVADTADELATACADLLEDPALRVKLVDEAHALYADRYRWSTIRRSFSDLATATAAPQHR